MIEPVSVLLRLVVTLPLVIAFSGRVPLGGLAANLLAGPVIPVITVVGTLAAVTAPPAAAAQKFVEFTVPACE